MRVMIRPAEGDSAALHVYMRDGVTDMAMDTLARRNVEFDAVHHDMLESYELVYDDFVSSLMRPIVKDDDWHAEASDAELKAYAKLATAFAENGAKLFRDPDTMPHREGEEMRGERSAFYQAEMLIRAGTYGLFQVSAKKPWQGLFEQLGLTAEHIKKIQPAVDEADQEAFAKASGEFLRWKAAQSAQPHATTKPRRQQRNL